MSMIGIRNLLYAAVVCLALAGPAPVQAAEPPVDRLGVPGPIAFAGASYHLAWSAQLSADYTRQEYLPSGQRPETYTDMISVERLTSGVSAVDAVKAQTQMLDQRKSTDALVNYRLIQNPDNGQIVLDFLMSDESSGTLIVEWDAYRYVPVTLPNGKPAVVLFAVSRRHYGDGASAFLKALAVKRTADIDALVTHAVPGTAPAN